jgi:hypothetical protein
MSNMSVGGQYYGGEIFGATISAPIWQQAMNGALADQPVLTFNPPTGFPADQPTAGSPIVSGSPTALGRPRTPIVVLPGGGTTGASGGLPGGAPRGKPRQAPGAAAPVSGAVGKRGGGKH